MFNLDSTLAKLFVRDENVIKMLAMASNGMDQTSSRQMN